MLLTPLHAKCFGSTEDEAAYIVIEPLPPHVKVPVVEYVISMFCLLVLDRSTTYR